MPTNMPPWALAVDLWKGLNEERTVSWMTSSEKAFMNNGATQKRTDNKQVGNRQNIEADIIGRVKGLERRQKTV